MDSPLLFYLETERVISKGKELSECLCIPTSQRSTEGAVHTEKTEPANLGAISSWLCSQCFKWGSLCGVGNWIAICWKQEISVESCYRSNSKCWHGPYIFRNITRILNKHNWKYRILKYFRSYMNLFWNPFQSFPPSPKHTIIVSLLYTERSSICSGSNGGEVQRWLLCPWSSC